MALLLGLPLLGRLGTAHDAQYVNGWAVVAVLLVALAGQWVETRWRWPHWAWWIAAAGGLAWWWTGTHVGVQEATKWGLALLVLGQNWASLHRLISPRMLLIGAMWHAILLSAQATNSLPPIYSNVNHGAAFIALLWAWWFALRPKRHAGQSVVWALSATSMVLSGSRAALLVLLLITAHEWFGGQYLRGQLPRKWRMAGAIMLLLGMISLTHSGLRTPVFATARSWVKDASMGERFDVWEFSFAVATPVGLGPGTWQRVARGYLAPPDASRRQPRRPHNTFIHAFSEGGWGIAFLCFYALLGAPVFAWLLAPLLLFSYPLERPELVWAMAMWAAAWPRTAVVKTKGTWAFPEFVRLGLLGAAACAWGGFTWAMHLHGKGVQVRTPVNHVLEQIFPLDVNLNPWQILP